MTFYSAHSKQLGDWTYLLHLERSESRLLVKTSKKFFRWVLGSFFYKRIFVLIMLLKLHKTTLNHCFYFFYTVHGMGPACLSVCLSVYLSVYIVCVFWCHFMFRHWLCQIIFVSDLLAQYGEHWKVNPKVMGWIPHLRLILCIKLKNLQ